MTTEGGIVAIHAHQSAAQGGAFLADITDFVASYNHEIAADGGCLSAQLVLTLRMADAQDWFAAGLGRAIKVYVSGGVLVWSGFVNLITLSAGSLSGESRGPLLEIANRVSAVYSPIDVTVYPPVVGSPTVTTIAENAVSQGAYGIIEKVLSAGTCTDDDAEYARDVYLSENAYPLSSGDLQPAAANETAITLECLGNVFWLDTYIYNNYDTGFVTLSDKIKAVLSADPNSAVSSNQAYIDDNGLLTVAVDNSNRFARAIIDSLVALGDVNNARWLFGVDENSEARYKQVPTTTEYYLRLADERQAITNADGGIVEPWEVKPGRWIEIIDWLPGYVIDTDNPRRKFIESVRFEAPATVTLAGGRVGTLRQILAKIGGGG